MSPELCITLDLIASVMPANAKWWIIGSTAMKLAGVEVTPQDVDVLGSKAVIEGVRLRLGVPPTTPSPNALFRSNPYFKFTPLGGLEADFMGDFELCTDSVWKRLVPQTRMATCGVFTPSLTEQMDILRRFGRPKDLQRIELIKAYQTGA